MTLTPAQEVVLSILSYSFCSGTLVLLNKLTLHYLPFPSLVVSVQLLACIFLIYGAQHLGYVDVDPIRWVYVKPYMLYIFFFSFGVYCNMRSLNISNVETIIVFRALSPAIVAFLDALFLGREWPSPRSWAGLVTIIVGAYGYASYDEKFQTQGWSAYSWPSLYCILIALEMVRFVIIFRTELMIPLLIQLIISLPFFLLLSNIFFFLEIKLCRRMERKSFRLLISKQRVVLSYTQICLDLFLCCYLQLFPKNTQNFGTFGGLMTNIIYHQSA